MHSPARNKKLSHVISYPLDNFFLSGTLAEADRMPQNFKFKIEVFPLAFCLTPCGRRVGRTFPKYFLACLKHKLEETCALRKAAGREW